MDVNPRHFWKKAGETGSKPASFTRDRANSQFRRANPTGIGHKWSIRLMSQHMIWLFAVFKLASEFAGKNREPFDLPGNEHEQIELFRCYPFDPTSFVVFDSNVSI
jgi:hypothetical protein